MNQTEPEQTTAEELAESFINGNRGYVRKQIIDQADLGTTEAVVLALDVYRALDESHRDSFRRLFS